MVRRDSRTWHIRRERCLMAVQRRRRGMSIFFGLAWSERSTLTLSSFFGIYLSLPHGDIRSIIIRTTRYLIECTARIRLVPKTRRDSFEFVEWCRQWPPSSRIAACKAVSDVVVMRLHVNCRTSATPAGALVPTWSKSTSASLVRVRAVFPSHTA